jgi:hypothetical protein
VVLLLGCSPGAGTSGGAVGGTTPVVPVASTQASDATFTEGDREAERRAVVDRVAISQRAGLVDRDLAAYIAPWDVDAKLVGGRRLAPGPGDWSLSREQNEWAKRTGFDQNPTGVTTLTFEDVEVSLDGDRAVLTWTATTSAAGWHETVGERYELRRRDGAWFIVLNRYWPIEQAVGDAVTRFDEAGLSQLDELVVTAKKGGDAIAIVRALLAAWRFPEAYQAAKRASTSPDTGATAEIWYLLATTALLVGESNDAIGAYKHANRIAP